MNGTHMSAHMPIHMQTQHAYTHAYTHVYAYVCYQGNVTKLRRRVSGAVKR